MLFHDFRSQIQFPKTVVPQYGWWGYRRGESKLCNSHFEAVNFSDAGVERVFINEVEYNEFYKQHTDCLAQTFKLWFNWLRTEYAYLSDNQWQLCYNLASKDCDEYDLIAEKLEDVVKFAISFSAEK